MSKTVAPSPSPHAFKAPEARLDQETLNRDMRRCLCEMKELMRQSQALESKRVALRTCVLAYI